MYSLFHYPTHEEVKEWNWPVDWIKEWRAIDIDCETRSNRLKKMGLKPGNIIHNVFYYLPEYDMESFVQILDKFDEFEKMIKEIKSKE